ncbi:MAG: hypothetical protein AB1644_10115 [Candidatus Zixiibacteriota bacterium]
MKKTALFLKTLAFCLPILGMSGAPTAQTPKLSALQAGTISQPTGRIAFIREKAIWVMDATGANQMKVVSAQNADGRMSWSPDGRRIAFTRSGSIDYAEPDGTGGGKHKLYDIFIAYIDSAQVGNTFFWRRLTDDLGSRDPDWSLDGNTIIFTKDVNANAINAQMPNYQLCVMNPEGGDFQLLRKDWANMPEFLMSPSMNAKGEIAFVHFFNQRPQGLAVLPRERIMTPLDSIGKQSAKMLTCLVPSWSPDGKWIAYVKNDPAKPGIYIATPDLAKSYLVYEPPAGVGLITIASSFSPDSKWLTFSSSDGSIWISDITGSQVKRLSGPGLDFAPAWSKQVKR